MIFFSQLCRESLCFNPVFDFLRDKLGPRGVKHHFSVVTVEENDFEATMTLPSLRFEVTTDWANWHDAVVGREDDGVAQISCRCGSSL